MCLPGLSSARIAVHISQSIIHSVGFNIAASVCSSGYKEGSGQKLSSFGMGKGAVMPKYINFRASVAECFIH
jgi:hypothetical protein